MVPGVVPAAAEITTWIACDSCNKWRRIPKDLADSVKEDAHWCALRNVPLTPLSARGQEHSLCMGPEGRCSMPHAHLRCYQYYVATLASPLPPFATP